MAVPPTVVEDRLIDAVVEDGARHLTPKAMTATVKVAVVVTAEDHPLPEVPAAESLLERLAPGVEVVGINRR